MDRLPSSHHPDNCGCAEVQALWPARGAAQRHASVFPRMVREDADKPCQGRANGCIRECCRPSRRAAAEAAGQRRPVPGKPRFAAREREAA